jgi:dihydrofolate synthase / folylpolyglutamate synthase
VSLPPVLSAGAEALLAPRLEQRILPGLERMRRALDALGRPDRRLVAVLVLGTNGKGSTAVLLAEILRAHGLHVGLYTSPHLLTVEERIRIDGAAIDRHRLVELVARLNGFPDLSYFETLTCAAVLDFVEGEVDVAVLEAGLGGRWDASNAVDPAVALLTNVGTDHQKWLGESRAAIAAEKAVALRGRAAIVGRWDDEVEPIIRSSAEPATSLSLAREWAVVTGVRGPGPGVREGTQLVRFEAGGVRGEALMPLLGEHQLANLELALAGASALGRHGLAPPLRAEAVVRGIEAVRWPGRLQWCTAGARRLLVDGAHNLEATAALADAVGSMGLAGGVDLLFSCLDDKPLNAMASLLRARAVGVTVAPIDSPRATPLEVLAAAFPGCRTTPSVTAALGGLSAERPTLVTGSLRLAGEVLTAIGAPNG